MTDNSDNEYFWDNNNELSINNISCNLLNALGMNADDNRVTTWEPPKVSGLSNSSKVNNGKHLYNEEPTVEKQLGNILKTLEDQNSIIKSLKNDINLINNKILLLEENIKLYNHNNYYHEINLPIYKCFSSAHLSPPKIERQPAFSLSY